MTQPRCGPLNRKRSYDEACSDNVDLAQSSGDGARAVQSIGPLPERGSSEGDDIEGHDTLPAKGMLLFVVDSIKSEGESHCADLRRQAAQAFELFVSERIQTANARKEVSDLIQALDRANADRKKLEDELEESARRCGALCSEKFTLRSEIRRARAENERLVAENARLRGANETNGQR